MGIQEVCFPFFRVLEVALSFSHSVYSVVNDLHDRREFEVILMSHSSVMGIFLRAAFFWESLRRMMYWMMLV